MSANGLNIEGYVGPLCATAQEIKQNVAAVANAPYTITKLIIIRSNYGYWYCRNKNDIVRTNTYLAILIALNNTYCSADIIFDLTILIDLIIS